MLFFFFVVGLAFHLLVIFIPGDQWDAKKGNGKSQRRDPDMVMLAFPCPVRNETEYAHHDKQPKPNVIVIYVVTSFFPCLIDRQQGCCNDEARNEEVDPGKVLCRLVFFVLWAAP